MPSMTITVEGEPKEVRAALIELLRLTDIDPRVGTSPLRGRGTAEEPSTAAETDVRDMEELNARTKWSPAELALVWHDMTDEAREAYAEIATRPDGYPFADLESALGKPMRKIGGNLSSFGHARRRHFWDGNKPTRGELCRRDWRKRQYTMDREVAGVIRDLAVSNTRAA